MQKKIYLAILVHEKKESIKDLVQNIRYFCPNSFIVLYNGGSDRDLCTDLSVPVCSHSKPLAWGKLAEFMLDTMKWLHEVQHEYDYLVTMDSDCLFAKRGYEEFILQEMEHSDYMGVEARIAESWWKPGYTLREEWSKWQPILHEGPLWGCFNPAQVFSKRLVERFLSDEKLNLIEKNMRDTEAFALEETLFINWAKLVGVVPKAYPEHVGRFVRFRDPYTAEEVREYVKAGHNHYLLHPVRREMQDSARVYIRSLLKGESHA